MTDQPAINDQKQIYPVVTTFLKNLTECELNTEANIELLGLSVTVSQVKPDVFTIVTMGKGFIKGRISLRTFSEAVKYIAITAFLYSQRMKELSNIQGK